MNKQTQMVIFGAVAAVIVLAVGAYFLFSGGDDGTSTTAPPPAPINVGGGDPLQPAQLGTGASPFGGGAAPSMPSSMTAKPAEERAFVARKDPFAYLPKEQEAMQVGAYDMAGFYRAAGPPKPPPPPVVEIYEPQPYRRIAGIIEGPTISAILEQEGELPQIVHPGDTIGEFRVASIDMAGITLKRSKGNPRIVRVPYEPPAGGAAGGGTGGGGGDRRGGFEGGGMPGAAGMGGGAAPGGPPGRGGRGGRGGGGMDL